MSLEEYSKKKLIMQAKRLYQYSEMLIKQCDSWIEESDVKKEKKKTVGETLKKY